jgi:aryl-alcohol dehydrogenase-like predicted oxidoreductase
MIEGSRKSGRVVSRREFVRDSAFTAAGLAAYLHSGGVRAQTPKPLNYNEDMEYRRLGNSGLMVSAICLGGHWKRIGTLIPGITAKDEWGAAILNHPDFIENRWDIVSYCIEKGINYVDACSGNEILAYTNALKGRRDKMYLGYSWHLKEPRFPEWRTAAKLMQGLDEGLKESGQDYVDVWRISAIMPGSEHTFNETYEIVAALAKAKKQGKARFIGISSHDREYLKIVINEFPEQMEVILTPYTAKTSELPKTGQPAIVWNQEGSNYESAESRETSADKVTELLPGSIFETIRKNDVGVFGIKPFASNHLFKGDSSPNSPTAEEDDRRARLAIRYILGNPAVTAPIPGMINRHQVDNLVLAIKERRELDAKEMSELRKAGDEAWAKLPEEYQWLKKWEYV